MVKHFIKPAIILSAIFLCTLPACDEEPTSPGGNGNLSIITDKNVYSWQQEEWKDRIHIQGQIKNKSESIFYSELGDFINAAPEQELLFVCQGSTGYIEKYNDSNNSWYEINLLAPTIEGTKFIQIKPSAIYSISGFLSKDHDVEEKGTYRLRIDYYDHEEPDSAESPSYDYSNTFVIEE